ncbi:MAG: Uma2 family endonuclease [Pseudoxanthomonas sp.]
MPAPSARKPFVSIEGYLAGEMDGEQRHEYIDGQVYAMGGASDRHGLIVNAIAFALTPAARRKGCQLFTSDMKVRVDIADKTSFYYPDLLLACEPDDRETYYRRAPCLLVEVLSASTARIDRREKLLAYQTLPSLQGYLLVEQDTMRVELYRRDNGWRMEEFEQGEVMLPCLDMALPLVEIYQDVQALDAG